MIAASARAVWQTSERKAVHALTRNREFAVAVQKANVPGSLLIEASVFVDAMIFVQSTKALGQDQPDPVVVASRVLESNSLKRQPFRWVCIIGLSFGNVVWDLPEVTRGVPTRGVPPTEPSRNDLQFRGDILELRCGRLRLPPTFDF